MRPHATNWGFTLIELMVALAIGALLLLFGMPSFTTYIRNSEIRSTAESIINGLRTAKSEAVTRNTPVHFTLSSTSSADWTLWFYEDDKTTKTTIQTYAKREAGPNSVVTTTPAAELEVAFDGLGRVVQATPHFQTIDITSAVPGEARSLRIIVDDPSLADPSKPRGMRMCDPVLTTTDPRAC